MMAKAQAQANTDVQGLFDAMSIAGSTANTVGWSFSDLAVLTGVFGDHSIGASEGATALNTGLMKLADPAKEATEWLDQLGISVFDTDGSLKSMPETIAELQNGFTGLSDQEQLAAASAIFGKNQAAKWVTLINGPGIEALQGYKDSIEGATGASQAMADALMSGPGGAMEQLKSTFDVFKYNAGEALSGAVVPFIEKITELLDRFNKMDPEQQKQIVKWAMMVAAVGPVLMVFGNTVSMVGKIGGAFTNLSRFASMATTGFKGLTAGSSALRVGIAAISTPAGIVIAVIAAIVVVVVAVVTHFNAFKAAMNTTSPTMQKLKASFEEIKSKIEPFIPVLLQVGKVVWDVLGNGIAMAAGIAVSAFAGMFSGIAGIISGIITAIQGIITFIKGVFTGDWQMAWDGITQIFKGWVQGITGFIDSIKGAIGGIIDGIKGAADFVAGGGGSPSKTTVPAKARGDYNWMGGLVQVNEKGGEIIDLPHGTRIYPHDESVRMAKGSSGTVLNIPKLADQIIVREDADIDRIGDAIAKKIMASRGNRGGMSFNASMA